MGNGRSAEACLNEALEIARARGMKLAELRTAISLGRLWKAGDRRAEAIAMLSQLYDSFTEGFEIADLREARALLDALAPQSEQQASK